MNLTQPKTESIKFIIGKAGTAKTTTLIKIIKQINNPSSVIVLAYTHQAVNNIKQRLEDAKLSEIIEEPVLNYTSTTVSKEFQKQKPRFPSDDYEKPSRRTSKDFPPNFVRTKSIKIEKGDEPNSPYDVPVKTIHSFFQITPDQELNFDFTIDQNSSRATKRRYIQIPEYVIIDEISLIPNELLDIIFKLCKKSQLILVGDLLQLNPVNNNLTTQGIDTKPLLKIKDFATTFQTGLLLAQHLSNNMFTRPEFANATKMILKKNYRSNEEVSELTHKMLDNPEIYIEHMFNDWANINQYTIIASRHSLLKKVYNMTNHQGVIVINSDIGLLNLKYKETVMLTKNLNKDFVNGDLVKVVNSKSIINLKETKTYNFECDEEYMLSKKLPILPSNYLTIHKSQGLGFDKIVVVLDDLFEISMLYTALTRAKQEIKFLFFDRTQIDSLKRNCDAFKKLESLVYNSEFN